MTGDKYDMELLRTLIGGIISIVIIVIIIMAILPFFALMLIFLGCVIVFMASTFGLFLITGGRFKENDHGSWEVIHPVVKRNNQDEEKVSNTVDTPE